VHPTARLGVRKTPLIEFQAMMCFEQISTETFLWTQHTALTAVVKAKNCCSDLVCRNRKKLCYFNTKDGFVLSIVNQLDHWLGPSKV
jgi:hypothetical protein